LDTTFFETVERNPNTSVGSNLGRYFSDVLGREPTSLNLREYRMEEVFGDVYYDFLENQTGNLALRAYTELVRLYLQVLRETTNWLADDSRRSAPIGRLIAAACEVADEVTIITFNHDLVIENEIDRRAKLRKLWCVTEGYGAVSKELNVLEPGVNVPVLSHHSDDCEHKIRIIKPHGSLNWVHRLNSKDPTARFLEGHINTDLLLLPAKSFWAESTSPEEGVAGEAGGFGRSLYRLSMRRRRLVQNRCRKHGTMPVRRSFPRNV